MWTPRRVGLLLLGVAGFVAAYLVYSYALGGFDGLPAIPSEYLKTATGPAVPRYPVSTTIERLQQAFGPDSPEGGTSLEYKNRLQIPGRDGVLACGSPVPNGTPLVMVAPISVALFGKPSVRPRPGEVPDISTFHADKAVLRFDRPVSKIEEMNTAKVVSIELTSDPDDNPNVATEKKDKRKGRIWISHNRKSPDPADHVVVRTVGPLFVQLPDETTPEDPNVPHVWTTAPVEVFDRQNLPRKLRSRPPELSRMSAVKEVTENVPPVAALARPVDLRRYGAVADILTGDSLPPPTVVAVGMKVFLATAKPDPAAPKQARAGRQASFSGAREIVLCEQVQMCLWTDGTSGFPGSETDARGQKAEAPPLGPNQDPPVAIQSVVGGLLDGGTLANRLETRSLLLIDTPGAFHYDLEKSLATFDTSVPPAADRQNFVVVTRLSAGNRTDDLVCSKLTLDLLDPSKANHPAGAEPPADTGLAVRGVTADGPQVYISVQAEGLEASGTKLKYTSDAKEKRSVVTLWGTPKSPVIAKRDGSQLTAGDPVQDAVVEIVTVEGPAETKPITPTDKKTEKATTVAILGPGRLELVDKTGGGGGGVVRWGRSLRQEKLKQAGRLLDLYKFDENAAFVDPQSGFTLKSQSIWLWTSAGEAPKAEAAPGGKKPPAASGSLPERLIATGDVHVDSDEMVIRRTNKLTVWFRDTKPPAPAATAVAAKPKGDAPLPEVPPVPGGEQPKVAAVDPPKGKEPAKEPEKPNPIRLQADTIETWVARYPLPPDEGKAVGPPAAKLDEKPKLKYQLETARCDDNVWVQQDPDPNDPNRPANGIDIRGNKLTLEHAPPAGSVLTVTGGRDKDNFAAVTFEGTTIHGNTVVIDQPNNAVSVDGRGVLTSLTGSDVVGNDLSAPSKLVVLWSKKMKFEGAKSFAQFVGTVTVQQKAAADPPGKPAALPTATVAERLPQPREAGPANTTVNTSNVWCHQLDLTLDRPVYFNQLQGADRNQRTAAKPPADRAKGAATADTERPKVKAVTALPSDEPAAEPHEKYVIYRETAEDARGAVVKARMITAKQLDFANRAKEQELYAAGPGELRILQPESSNDQPPQPSDPNARVSAKPPDKDKGEMKLTVVNFQSKMIGTDKGSGEYQEAKFDDGAKVMNAPGTDLTARLEPHALPKGSIYLTCRDQMIVSSVKTKKDAPADQRLTAIGNAEFRDDNRTGLGDKIVYDGTRVTLLGTDKRLAKLESNRKGLNTEQSTRAKKFVYNSKTGLVEVSESSGGSFSSGK